VATWRGFAYAAFVVDVFSRRIVGRRGDSYDNALAESVIGLYKTELIHPRTHISQPPQYPGGSPAAKCS
jgi:transposase InsO family protein